MTRRSVHHLERWQRRTLYGLGFLLLVTGTGWLVVHYSIGAGAGDLPHPLETWALRLHGAAAFGALFMLGALAGSHIPRGWRLTERRHYAHQRNSGVMLCALGASMALTGYLLYYFAPEAIRPALGWAHAAIGVTMAVLVASHRRGA